MVPSPSLSASFIICSASISLSGSPAFVNTYLEEVNKHVTETTVNCSPLRLKRVLLEGVPVDVSLGLFIKDFKSSSKFSVLVLRSFMVQSH